MVFFTWKKYSIKKYPDHCGRTTLKSGLFFIFILSHKSRRPIKSLKFEEVINFCKKILYGPFSMSHRPCDIIFLIITLKVLTCFEFINNLFSMYFYNEKSTGINNNTKANFFLQPIQRVSTFHANDLSSFPIMLKRQPIRSLLKINVVKKLYNFIWHKKR